MKKFLLGLICYSMGVLAIGNNVHVHADSNGVTPRAMVVSCPECGAMVTGSPIDGYTIPGTAKCAHGKSGYDSVNKSYITYALSCSGHYYETYDSLISTSIVRCNGY